MPSLQLGSIGDSQAETLQHCAAATQQAPAGSQIAAAASLTGHPRLKLYTLSCRLEMYVAEDTWLGCSR